MKAKRKRTRYAQVNVYDTETGLYLWKKRIPIDKARAILAKTGRK